MTGLQRLLSHAPIYRLFSSLVGAKRGRERLAIEFIKAMPGAKVLDIGCGPAEILDVLEGVEYVGFDANANYIADARRRWSGRGTFVHDTVGRPRFEDEGFDVALALGVIHHLDDVQAGSLFNTAYRALHSGGRLITLDGMYTETQAGVVRFLLANDRGKFIRTLERYESLARARFETVRSTVLDDLMHPLPYTHLVMECIKS